MFDFFLFCILSNTLEIKKIKISNIQLDKIISVMLKKNVLRLKDRLTVAVD